jgi:hypothetical protein
LFFKYGREAMDQAVDFQLRSLMGWMIEMAVLNMPESRGKSKKPAWKGNSHEDLLIEAIDKCYQPGARFLEDRGLRILNYYLEGFTIWQISVFESLSQERIKQIITQMKAITKKRLHKNGLVYGLYRIGG